jgi:hypothetical protein
MIYGLKAAYFLGNPVKIALFKSGRIKFHNYSTSVVD